MARAAGYQNFSAADLHYGKLSGQLGDILGLNPTTRVGVLVMFEHYDHEWHWIMHPQVSDALEQLQWNPCRRITHMEASSQ